MIAQSGHVTTTRLKPPVSTWVHVLYHYFLCDTIILSDFSVVPSCKQVEAAIQFASPRTITLRASDHCTARAIAEELTRYSRRCPSLVSGTARGTRTARRQ